MRKILARESGFKLVFQNLFSERSLVDELLEEFSLTEEERAYSLSILNCVLKNKETIENNLQKNLKNNLKLSDIFKLDLAILFCAMAEIDYLNEDKPLVINEAVKIAKKYSTDKSSKFVNGVLSSIYNK